LNPSSATTTLDLIRHGIPEGGRRYRGWVDDPLSEKGWAQMRAAVGERCDWDAIVSSPLRRCRAFAEELAARHGLPLTIDERFKEVGFGSWEGRTKAEVSADDAQRLLRFADDPVSARPEGAEPLDSFRQRIGAALEDVLAHHRGERVLIVGHAGMIRMCIAWTLDLPDRSLYRIQVGNADITRLKFVEEAGYRLPQLHFHAGVLA